MCKKNVFSKFEQGDIDIFIFDKRNLPCDHVINKFIRFLKSNFFVKHIIKNGTSILNIHIHGMHRTIQIIKVKYSSFSCILSGFDTAHNRCCIYKGSFYITHDAKYSKNTKSTYLKVFNDNVISRLCKIKEYDLHIVNYNSFVNERILNRSMCSRYFKKSTIINEGFLYNYNLDFLDKMNNYSLKNCDRSKLNIIKRNNDFLAQHITIFNNYIIPVGRYTLNCTLGDETNIIDIDEILNNAVLI